MSGDLRKEIDIIIKAQLQNGNSIEAVTRSITDLEKALKQQAEAAKKGEGSIDELRATLLSLQQVQDRLKDQAGVIGQFSKLSEQIAKSEQRAAKASQTLSQYQTKIGDVSKATEAQVERLTKLGTASDRAASSLDRQVKQQAELKAVLEGAGVDIGNLADSEERLRTAAAQLGISINNAQQSIKGFAGNARLAKQAADELAAAQARAAENAAAARAFTEQADAAARLVKASEYTRWWTEALAAQERQARESADASERLASAQAKAAAESAKFQRDFANAQRIVRESEYAKLFGPILDAADKQEKAQRRLNTTTEEGARSFNIFNSSGRTTLSLVQRIRGEVLSLAASYVGLFGAINAAKNALQAYNEKQAVLNQLTVMTKGDKGLAAKEYEYIANQAERLGINVGEASKGFAKFSISASLAGRSAQETRFIFESVSEVGRVAGLTKDQLSRVFFAISQIYSKGRVMAEEFNQQLGDALPGLLGVAKDATKDKFPDFSSAMKDGKVTLDDFVKIVAKYRESVSGQLPAAVKSLQADQERFNNALFDFNVLIADSGFGEGYKKLINDLSILFKSDDGKKFAESVAGAFEKITEFVKLVVENLGVLKGVLTIVADYFILKFLYQSSLGLANLRKEIVKVSVETGNWKTAVTRLNGAFAVLSVGMLAADIGSWLYNNVSGVRKAGQLIISAFHYIGTGIAGFFSALVDAAPELFHNLFAVVTNTLTAGVRQILTIFQKGAEAVGATDLSKKIGAVVSSMEVKTKGMSETTKHILFKLENDLQKIKDLQKEIWNEDGTPKATPAKNGSVTTPQPKPTGDKGVMSEEEKKKRLETYQSLEASIEAIEAKVEKGEKQSLASRIAAIDTEYQKLVRKVKAFGGAEGATLELRLTKATAELKLLETRKFNEELAKEQESLQTKLENLEAQAGKKYKDELQRRLDAVRISQEDTFRQIAAFRERLVNAGRDPILADMYKFQAEQSIKELQGLEKKQYLADQIKEQEKDINRILSERTDRIKVLNIEMEAGLITERDVREGTKKIIEDTQPRLADLVQKGEDFAAANKAALDPEMWAAFVAFLEESKNSAAGLRTELFTAKMLSEMLAQGATTAFEGTAKAIAGAIQGMNSWSDAIRATQTAFLNFAADFLMQIAKMIMQQAILNGMKSASQSGGFLGTAASWLNGLTGGKLWHEGGVVGSSGRSIVAPSAWFANAPRYHTGGIAGLAPDEYPAILKKNEEVLTAGSPRNILNGGAGSGTSRGGDVKIINMIDSGSVVSEGLASQSGERAFFNFIRANRTSLKTMLG